MVSGKYWLYNKVGGNVESLSCSSVPKLEDVTQNETKYVKYAVNYMNCRHSRLIYWLFSVNYI